MANIDLDALALILRDAIAAAYSEGATDVHNAWVNETNGREPDFGEAASDYAASIDAINLPAIIKAADKPWYDALINELIVLHLYTAEHEKDPRKALADAIEWNVKIALDPAVSQAARDLVSQAKAEAYEDAAKLCDRQAEGRQIQKTKTSNRTESRDYHTMAIQAVHDAFAIRQRAGEV